MNYIIIIIIIIIIISGDQKSDLHCTLFQSSPKVNHMHITGPSAYYESLQHPTIAVFLI